MSKVAARNGSLGIDDSTGTCRAMGYLVSRITLNLSAETPETTGFGNTYRERQQDGLKDGELSFEAFFANGANETDIVLSAILGASTRWVFGPSGSTAGLTRYSASSILSKYEMNFQTADAGQCSGTFALRTGGVVRDTFS
jgi:hypothetical protein